MGLCAPRILSGNLFCCLNGRRKNDPQSIVAGLQIRLRIQPIRPKHVVGGQQQVAVQIHLRAGVEAVEDQLNILSIQKFFVDRNAGAILPVGILDPLQFVFVVSIERLRDQLVAQQIQLHIAGNRGGHPLGMRDALQVGDLPKLPPLIQ